jgi:hypothetical protein
MRTSITLDQDVYELAYLYARGNGITLSAAINELARKSQENKSTKPHSDRLQRAPNGLLIARPQGRVITNEMVKAALEEEDEEYLR